MTERPMHLFVAGSGPMLQPLTRQFHSAGHRVSLLVPDVREAENLSVSLKASVFAGSAIDPELLSEIWSAGVDLVLALTASDHDNLGICRFAKQHFGVARVFALVNNPENVEIFSLLDVEAFCPLQIIAQMIEQRSVTDAVRNLAAIAGGQLLMTEYVVSPEDAICGSTLGEIALPEDMLVACVTRAGTAVLPRGDTRILGHDALAIITTPGRQADALRLLGKS